jgi:NADPH:quinone reductase-like Zn-dependent oxidoreductase
MNGTFAEYVVAKADLCLSLPDDWSFEDAAQLTGVAFTATQTLSQTLGFARFPAPATPEPTSIFIYGASSSVGCFTVQFAKIGGLKVYAVCSPRNFGLVKGLGADEVFDYKDPEAAKNIKDATGGKLKYAVDAISAHGSGKFISDVFSDEGGKIATVLPYESPRANIEATYSSAAALFVDVRVRTNFD